MVMQVKAVAKAIAFFHHRSLFRTIILQIKKMIFWHQHGESILSIMADIPVVLKKIHYCKDVCLVICKVVFYNRFDLSVVIAIYNFKFSKKERKWI